MIKHIISGVIILVLALLIFSYISSPSVKSKVSLEFQRIKDDLKEGFKNVELRGGNDNAIKGSEEKTEEEVKEEIIPEKEDIEEKPKEDRLMVNCKDSFQECKRIGIKKYGWSISLSETEKFYDKETAEEFYNTWSSILGIGQELELNYPIVLFAFSMKKGGNQLPDIAVCEDGELTESSKLRLGC